MQGYLYGKHDQDRKGAELKEADKRENPLISVIVTAYNIEKYLPECLDSLLAQTYRPMEIILVEDGSTDGTAQICDRYRRDHEEITVLHQKNAGPSAARNAGIAAAKGSYIGFVDGDDFVEPCMYEKMYRACEQWKAQIAICTYRQLGEGAEEIHPSGKEIPLSKQEALEIYISGHPSYHIYHSVWSKLFKREILQGISFPVGRKSEDIMYTTWALTRAEQCVFLDTPLYNYRVDRGGSIMNTQLGQRRFQDEIPFWREQIAYLDEQGMEILSRKAAYQFYRRMLFYFLDFKKRHMTREASQLIRMLRMERKQIKSVYGEEFVAWGDRVRMGLALAMPGLYFYTVKLYDKAIIPLRQKSV